MCSLCFCCVVDSFSVSVRSVLFDVRFRFVVFVCLSWFIISVVAVLRSFVFIMCCCFVLVVIFVSRFGWCVLICL